MPPRVVSHYGVHWTDSTEGLIAWLDQEKVDRRTEAIVPTGTNVRGYSAKSPFDVRPIRRGLRCPHRIQLIVQMPEDAHWKVFREMLARCGLLRVIVPAPRPDARPGATMKDGAYYFVHPAGVPAADLNTRIALMANMCTPVGPIRIDADAIDRNRLSLLIDELTITNLAPIVITGVEPRHTNLLRRLGEVAPTAPRCLVAVGSAAVPLQPGWTRPSPGIGVHKFEMELLAMLPWQQLGATVCRQYMRQELGWLPDRPDLRDLYQQAPSKPWREER